MEWDTVKWSCERCGCHVWDDSEDRCPFCGWFKDCPKAWQQHGTRYPVSQSEERSE